MNPLDQRSKSMEQTQLVAAVSYDFSCADVKEIARWAGHPAKVVSNHYAKDVSARETTQFYNLSSE